MSSTKFDHKKTPLRFSCLVIIMMAVTLAMLGKALYMMTAERKFWLDVSERVKLDSTAITPTRGNILSCDGKLMASSLPEFEIFMDFKTLHDAGTDTLW